MEHGGQHAVWEIADNARCFKQRTRRMRQMPKMKLKFVFEFSWNWNWVQEMAIAWHRRPSRLRSRSHHNRRMFDGPMHLNLNVAFLRIDEVSAVFRLSTTHKRWAGEREREPRISSQKKYIHSGFALKNCWSGTRFVWATGTAAATDWCIETIPAWPATNLYLFSNWIRCFRCAESLRCRNEEAKII